MGKNISKNISKTEVVNTARTLLIMLKNLLQMDLKLFRKKHTVTNEEANLGLEREIPWKKHISPEKRQTIVDDLRLR